MKKLLALALLSASLHQTAQPLSDGAAELIAALSGVGAGTLTGVGIGYAVNNPSQHYASWGHPSHGHAGGNGAGALAGMISGLVVGGTVWFTLRAILLEHTPKGKLANFESAVRIAIQDHANAQRFADSIFTYSSGDLLKLVNVRYGTSWPLVKAREEITGMNGLLSSSKNSLEWAARGLASYLDWNEPSLDQKARARGLLRDAQMALSTTGNAGTVFSECLAAIQAHPYYMTQCQLYEQFLEAQRQREHEAKLERERQQHAAQIEREKIAAQAAITAATLGTQVHQNGKQREHEERLERERIASKNERAERDRREKERDRELKERMADRLSARPGTQATINVNI